MKFCSEVFACVLVIVRNKCLDNRSPFPAQNKIFSSWLFGCYALRRFSSPQKSIVGRMQVKGTHFSALCLHCASPYDTNVFLARWISISELFYDVRYSVLNLVI